MRLSPAQIKLLILHSDRYVRTAAVEYFTKAHCRDLDIVALVIEAVEKFGWAEAFEQMPRLDHLVHDESSLRWILGQLAGEDVHYGIYDATRHDTLRRALWGVDPRLLAQFAEEIRSLPSIRAVEQEGIAERLRLLDLDVETLWLALEGVCEAGKTADYITEFDLPRAEQLVEALARHPEQVSDRVLAILAETITDFEDNPQTWMEAFAVQMAGKMRLAEAGPLILNKMLENEDTDWFEEQCITALVQTASDELIDSLTMNFTIDSPNFFMTLSFLEDVHGEKVVERCAAILTECPCDDDMIGVSLCHAMLSQFDTAGIEPARRFSLEDESDGERCGVIDAILVVCEATQTTIPELDRWKTQREKRRTYRQKSYAEFDGPMLKRMFESLSDEDDEEFLETDKPDESDDDYYAVQPLQRLAPRVGRNDPCPCGSGKKFKKCCLNKKPMEVKLSDRM